MARISWPGTDWQLVGEAVIDYLTSQGIYFERWDLSGLPDRLRTADDLTGAEKIAVTHRLRSELQRVAEAMDYFSYDLLMLCPEVTPDLEEALKTYQKPHRHQEDEVRLVIDGEVTYTVTANGRTFTVKLEPGDLLCIPAGVRHNFVLTGPHRLKAIRMFQSQAGWMAVFDAQEVL